MAQYRPHLRALLIVDDEPDIRESLALLFETHDPAVDIYTASDGEEALKILEEHEVDLILSDYKMPGMDGIELLVKARDMQPKAARILVTAFPDEALAQRAIAEASIQNFFNKPIQPEPVLEAVNSAILKARQQAG